MQKPAIPKGTRDFSQIEMARRNYIFSTIRDVFALYGFAQIETPAMELMSTLMGKYGEEGDKLLFRIQNSGEKANEAPEKGLRYDLTRYREFYQCDVDVVGTDSLLAEVELIQIVEEVYRRLGINVCLHLNNRKVLAGIAEVIGAPDKMIDITVAIDKLDKIGVDKVNDELRERGLSAEAVEALQPILNLSGDNTAKLQSLRTILADSEIGLKGVAELEEVFNKLSIVNCQLSVELDLCLARGLNYYTGAIFEVKALDVQMGSITGGGRYDNLTGIFGMPDVSGVGISFGADRIYDVLTELDLYPAELQSTTQVLFACFGEDELNFAAQCATTLRAQGIRVEVYPEAVKMKRQMAYADAKHIPYVAIIGSNELAEHKLMLKNMLTGEQSLLGIEDVKEVIK